MLPWAWELQQALVGLAQGGHWGGLALLLLLLLLLSPLQAVLLLALPSPTLRP